MRSALLCLLIWPTCVSAGLAKTIYVDNVAGDDRFRGERAENTVGFAGPVRTIRKALRLVEPGSRIVLAKTDRPYREAISFVGQRHSGSETDMTLLDGNGAILDGSRDVPSGAWEHYQGDIFRFRPERMGHQQLFLDGRPLLRAPITKGSMQPAELKPLEWCMAGDIYFRVEPQRLPRDYQLSYAYLPTGITLYHVRDVMIGNLIVQGFQTDGLQCHDAHGVQLMGLTCRGNGRSGITVTGSSRAEIGGCLIGDNGAAQLRAEGYSQTRVFESELLENTAVAYLLAGGKLWIDGQRVEVPSNGTQLLSGIEPRTSNSASSSTSATVRRLAR